MDSPAICSAFFSHMVRRGMRAGEVNLFFKDIFKEINEGSGFEISALNKRLKEKKWPGNAIDEIAYDLIKQLLENEIKNQR